MERLATFKQQVKMMKKTIRDYIREKIDYLEVINEMESMEEYREEYDDDITIVVMSFITGCGYFYDFGDYCVEGINIGSDINLDFMENADIKENMIEYIDEWRQEWLAYDDEEYEKYEEGHNIRNKTNIQIMNHYAYWYGCKEIDDEFFEELFEEVFSRNRIVLK